MGNMEGASQPLILSDLQESLLKVSYAARELVKTHPPPMEGLGTLLNVIMTKSKVGVSVSTDHMESYPISSYSAAVVPKGVDQTAIAILRTAKRFQIPFEVKQAKK